MLDRVKVLMNTLEYSFDSSTWMELFKIYKRSNDPEVYNCLQDSLKNCEVESQRSVCDLILNFKGSPATILAKIDSIISDSEEPLDFPDFFSFGSQNFYLTFYHYNLMDWPTLDRLIKTGNLKYYSKISFTISNQSDLFIFFKVVNLKKFIRIRVLFQSAEDLKFDNQEIENSPEILEVNCALGFQDNNHIRDLINSFKTKTFDCLYIQGATSFEFLSDMTNKKTFFDNCFLVRSMDNIQNFDTKILVFGKRCTTMGDGIEKFIGSIPNLFYLDLGNIQPNNFRFLSQSKSLEVVRSTSIDDSLPPWKWV